MNLKDKKIFITGAAGGFGTELTRLSLIKGARVDAVDLDLKGLQKLKKDMKKLGYQIHIQKLDVTKDQDYKKYIEATKADPAQVWINNAGISFPKAFSETDPKLFDKIMDVNVKGVILGTRHGLQIMKKRKGIIVNVASMAGHIPVPFLTSYVTSKHAVVGFTRSLGLELELQGSPVKMMLVSPGFANTNVMKSNAKEFPMPPDFLVGSAEEVAKAIIRGIEKEKDEINPVRSGRAFQKLFQFAPRPVYQAIARMVTGANWKQALGLEAVRKSDR